MLAKVLNVSRRCLRPFLSYRGIPAVGTESALPPPPRSWARVNVRKSHRIRAAAIWSNPWALISSSSAYSAAQKLGSVCGSREEVAAYLHPGGRQGGRRGSCDIAGHLGGSNAV